MAIMSPREKQPGSTVDPSPEARGIDPVTPDADAPTAEKPWVDSPDASAPWRALQADSDGSKPWNVMNADAADAVLSSLEQQKSSSNGETPSRITQKVPTTVQPDKAAVDAVSASLEPSETRDVPAIPMQRTRTGLVLVAAGIALGTAIVAVLLVLR